MKSFLFILLFVVLVPGCDEGSPYSRPLSPPIEIDSTPVSASAPWLSLGIGIETGDFSLGWSEPPGAGPYTLQSDISPSFTNAKVIYQGPDRTYYLGFGSDYFYSSYYRVRGGGDWSNWVKFPE